MQLLVKHSASKLNVIESYYRSDLLGPKVVSYSMVVISKGFSFLPQQYIKFEEQCRRGNPFSI